MDNHKDCLGMPANARTKKNRQQFNLLSGIQVPILGVCMELQAS